MSDATSACGPDRDLDRPLPHRATFLLVIVRIDVVPIVLEMRRVIVAEIIGGYHGQAQLGRWWLPSGPLEEGEQPGDAARRILKAQLGLDLEGVVVVGTRAAPVGGEAHGPTEWLDLDSVVPRTALLAGLLARLGAGGVGGARAQPPGGPGIPS